MRAIDGDPSGEWVGEMVRLRRQLVRLWSRLLAQCPGV